MNGRWSYPETVKLYNMAMSGSTEEDCRIVVGMTESFFMTDSYQDFAIDPSSLEVKDEWRKRLTRVAEVFSVENNPRWYLMAYMYC